MRETNRLSGIDLTILQLMVTLGGERYGKELVDKSDGLLARRSIYVYLSRMEDKGLIESHGMQSESGVSRGIPRKYYRISALGSRLHDERMSIGASFV